MFVEELLFESPLLRKKNLGQRDEKAAGSDKIPPERSLENQIVQWLSIQISNIKYIYSSDFGD